VFYGLFTVMLILVVFAVLSNLKFERRPREERREYREYVEEAIYRVKITSDPRGAILAAYREMENMMRSRGVRDEKYYTPREFEDFALSTLNLSREPVETLVSLFEHARYSNHPLSEEDRANALRALEAIRNELSS
jgi:hypothetical protein